MRRRVLASCLLLAFAACGDNLAAPAPDAAPPGPPDAAVFPTAPHPSAPQLISAGGPAPTSDADINTYLATMTDGTHAGWPKNDGSTIYTFFIPAADVLTDFPGECTSWGGYHSEAMGT